MSRNESRDGADEHAGSARRGDTGEAGNGQGASRINPGLRKMLIAFLALTSVGIFAAHILDALTAAHQTVDRRP
jgi:hypothetical protein